VGTTAIGQPHTGCTAYEVGPNSVQPLASQHVEYLQLEAEKTALDVILTRLERNPTWSAQDKATYAHVFQRLKEIMERQATLRVASGDDVAWPQAVNG
jgi:hypothetical protein